MFLSPEVQARLDARFFQMTIKDDVDSSSQKIPQKTIQSGFHFWSEFLTLTFNTLDDAGSDDGVCHLSSKFFTGANEQALGNDFISLSTIAIPGRQRAIGINGDPSNAIHTQGLPMPYLWEATGSIGMQVACDSVVANHFEAVWTGFLIPVRVCPTAEAFWEILASYRNLGGFAIPGRG